MLAFSNQPNNRAVNSKTILVTNQGVYNHDNTLQISLRNASLQNQTASEQLKITKRMATEVKNGAHSYAKKNAWIKIKYKQH